MIWSIRMPSARNQTIQTAALQAGAQGRTRSRRAQTLPREASRSESKAEEAPKASVSDLMDRPHLLPGWIDPVEPADLVAARRDIHRTPEPGWSEFIATARLAEAFRSAGFSITYGPQFISPQFVRGRDPEEVEKGRRFALEVGVPPEEIRRIGDYPGLLAAWDTGRPGRTIAIRIELDALAVEEPESPAHLPFREGFASVRHGVMHACGHDGHQAAAIALARFIAANADRLAGKIIFICQPAEEGSRGAYPILQSGVLHGVDTIFCAHIAPELEVGEVVAEPHEASFDHEDRL